MCVSINGTFFSGEHLWPRSYGLIDHPSLTDLHNIRPADVNVNSSRGNKYYGECGVKSNKCLKPANKEAASDTETDKEKWTPPLQASTACADCYILMSHSEQTWLTWSLVVVSPPGKRNLSFFFNHVLVRGDIARALMYMAVGYGFHQPGGGPGLRLSDSPSIRNREMGLLSTLLEWNEIDPPSREEKLRNERICKLYQHNRNPLLIIQNMPILYGSKLLQANGIVTTLPNDMDQ
ncbi:Extracellular ribonuclease [Vitis vinifera]|uniref:Extracellular ribonuclease n=1 Tax=Vitis vinifera TaxID=29760 RepID=A0A438GWZ6_VITVI|nr:Extracellular ribonuclease [Vitis vinifera]